MRKELPNGVILALPLVFFVVSISSPMFIRFFVETENNSYLSTTVKLILLSFLLLWILPYKIGVPSNQNKSSNIENLGLKNKFFNYHTIWLGFLLGGISLLFMFLGSAITGGYVFDISRINLNHLYFSLVPGVFEEVVFRGFIMVAAIRIFRNFKVAVIFQIVIFTISHLKDFSGWGIVDMITAGLIALAFTYVVLKTGHLYTAIIFHFLHDAFLFVVQKADGLQSFMENLVFYLFVIMGLIVIVVITKLVSEKFHFVEDNQYINMKLSI